MKISILKESLCLGGTERSVSNISLALAKDDDVKLVLYDGSNPMYPYGGELINLKLPAKTTTLSRVINNIRRGVRYYRHLISFKPDIVYQFISYNNPVGMLPIRNSVKIVSCRDFGALKNNIKKFKYRLNSSDAMICNSEYMSDYYLSHYPQDIDKVFTVNNIIDVDYIVDQAKVPLPDLFWNFRDGHKFLIVSTGRFCKEKSFESLIEVLFLLRKEDIDVGLVLIGDGKLKTEYIALIDRFEINDHVFLTGFQENPYNYMSICDVFVLSSISEGFPNVLVEAMALSLPVISVNCFSGPAEILMNQYDYNATSNGFYRADYGILVPHYNVNGSTNTIDVIAESFKYIINDQKVLNKYSFLSLERAKQFSVESSSQALNKVFNTLINRRQYYDTE